MSIDDTENFAATPSGWYCKHCGSNAETIRHMIHDDDCKFTEGMNLNHRTIDWHLAPDMFGHYRLCREALRNVKADDPVIKSRPGIYFRRHEIPDIILKLQTFYNTGEYS